ncbi:MAG: hypothetical protein AAF989_17075 [Planctomycetota bacterium]
MAMKNQDQNLTLPRVRISFSNHPSATELERVREIMFRRISDSLHGVLIDCGEIGTTTVDALACLHVTRKFADSERKRFSLIGVSPELEKTLCQHKEFFDLPIFGRLSASESVKSKPDSPSRKWLPPSIRRRVIRLGLPILVVFPVVAALEYFYVVQHEWGDETVMVQKTFESGDAFMVHGVIVGDAAVPAVVFITRLSVVPETWRVESGKDGEFQFAVPARQTLPGIDVEVSIVSDDRAQSTSHRIRKDRPLLVSWQKGS